MAHSHSKLEEALSSLIEAYSELEEEIDEQFGEDEDAFEHRLIEVLETSVETALEEQDASTNLFAALVASLSEALEQLDPTAFDDDEENIDYGVNDHDVDDDDDESIDLDDDDD